MSRTVAASWIGAGVWAGMFGLPGIADGLSPPVLAALPSAAIGAALLSLAVVVSLFHFATSPPLAYVRLAGSVASLAVFCGVTGGTLAAEAERREVARDLLKEEAWPPGSLDRIHLLSADVVRSAAAVAFRDFGLRVAYQGGDGAVTAFDPTPSELVERRRRIDAQDTAVSLEQDVTRQANTLRRVAYLYLGSLPVAAGLYLIFRASRPRAP